jgi:hypothetical protein
MRTREVRNTYKNMKGKYYLGELGVDGEII